MSHEAKPKHINIPSNKFLIANVAFIQVGYNTINYFSDFGLILSEKGKEMLIKDAYDFVERKIAEGTMKRETIIGINVKMKIINRLTGKVL